MNWDLILPAVTSLLALIFAAALFDQWLERRHTFQLVWAAGMLFFAIASGSEALAAALGWNELLYRTWYLTGAVWTAGWLGLGTAFLLGRTRFGYAFALCLFLAGLFTFLVRNRPEYAGAGALPFFYFVAAGVLALAVAVETYFQNERWPMLAAMAVVGATLLSVVLMVLTPLPPPGYALHPDTGMPVGTLFPPQLRLLTPFLNVTGRVRADPRGDLLGVRVHAEAARARVLARPQPERRPVPVQPADRAGRDRGEPRRRRCRARSERWPPGGSTAACRRRC